MKISFKYYFLGLAAVAVFLPVLYFGAPLILRVVDAVTATPPPRSSAWPRPAARHRE